MQLKDLYAKHGSLVYNLALNYLGNTEEAEEITQDVFLAVHQNQDKFREEAQWSTWIYRIAVNKSLDYLRSKNRKKRIRSWLSIEQDGHEAGHFNHPGFQLEQKEAVSRIYRLMKELPLNQYSALVLAKLEGKSQKEIAEILETSPKAVESLIQRAKKNLSTLLERNEGK